MSAPRTTARMFALDDEVVDVRAYEDLERRLAEGKMAWIPTSQEMPEDGQQCIWWSAGGYAHAGRYSASWIDRGLQRGPTFRGIGISMTAGVVTHWMPLPGGPK